LLTNFVNDFVVPDEATRRAYARFVLDRQIMDRLGGSTFRPIGRYGFARHGRWQTGVAVAACVDAGARLGKLCSSVWL
jgi:hypothetical protein